MPDIFFESADGFEANIVDVTPPQIKPRANKSFRVSDLSLKTNPDIKLPQIGDKEIIVIGFICKSTFDRWTIRLGLIVGICPMSWKTPKSIKLKIRKANIFLRMLSSLQAYFYITICKIICTIIIFNLRNPHMAYSP